MQSELFWDQYNRDVPSPQDVLLNNVSPQDARDFVRGCKTIYTEVRRYGPDVIIVPERGAGPIAWAVEEYEVINGLAFDKVFPLIGTHTDILTSRQGGFNSSTKKRILEAEFRNYADQRKGNPIRRALIFDEVQTGSTLSTAAKHSADILRSRYGCNSIQVIAAQDSRKPILERERVPAFIRMATNSFPDMPTTTILLPLFYVDRIQFLDYILLPSDADADKQPHMMHTLKNVEAQKLIKNLVFTVEHPQQLDRVLQLIRGNQELSYYDEETEGVQRIYDWILDIITTPDHAKMPDANAVLAWFSKLNNGVHEE